MSYVCYNLRLGTILKSHIIAVREGASTSTSASSPTTGADPVAAPWRQAVDSHQGLRALPLPRTREFSGPREGAAPARGRPQVHFFEEPPRGLLRLPGLRWRREERPRQRRGGGASALIPSLMEGIDQ